MTVIHFGVCCSGNFVLLRADQKVRIGLVYAGNPWRNFVRIILPRSLSVMICVEIYANSNLQIQGLDLSLLPCLLLNIVSVRFKFDSRWSRAKTNAAKSERKRQYVMYIINQIWPWHIIHQSRLSGVIRACPTQVAARVVTDSYSSRVRNL